MNFFCGCFFCCTSFYNEPRYIAENVTEIKLEELYKYPLIRYSADDLENAYWDEYQDNQKYILSTDNMNIYNQAIIDDIGVGIMSGIALQQNEMKKNILRKIYIKDVPENKLFLLTNINCPSEIRAKYEDVLLKLAEQW